MPGSGRHHHGSWREGGVGRPGGRCEAAQELRRQTVRVGRGVGVLGRQLTPLPARTELIVAGKLYRAGLATANHPVVRHITRIIAARGDGVNRVAADADVDRLGYSGFWAGHGVGVVG